MKTITIKLQEKEKTYPIYIGDYLVQSIASFINFSDYTRIAIVTDDVVKKIWLPRVLSYLPKETKVIVIPQGEKEKKIESVIYIWTKMKDYAMDRHSLLINLGGGVIGDMGGFAASTYMRGIDFLQIPTTILSQVDESVGGKTGIDFTGRKNLIGTFCQPTCVIIDVQTIKTLPKKIFLEGFSEIIKHGIIFDKTYFDFVTSKKPFKFSSEEMIDIISKSVTIKATIIQADEKEKGLRKLLNFGHTIGHAIESVHLKSRIPFSHGEAIIIGMIAETEISCRKGLLPRKDADHIKKMLKKIGLPVTVAVKKEAVINTIKTDKKSKGKVIHWTLLKDIGKAVINQHVEEQLVKEILDEVIS
jgi:3-dehydroquinate synthase